MACEPDGSSSTGKNLRLSSCTCRGRGAVLRASAAATYVTVAAARPWNDVRASLSMNSSSKLQANLGWLKLVAASLGSLALLA